MIVSNYKIRYLFCLIVVILFFSFFKGQLNSKTINNNKNRPKIGLVLSGGGAKSGAQIGALKALEELHVPIDFIAGTSTGSLIGALYAIGMSSSQIEESVLKIDWDDVLRKDKTRKSLFFRRKQDDLDSLVKYRLELNGAKISLPKSILNPHKLNLLIKNLLWPSNNIEDFNDLPIPFWVVTVDLETGDEVVIANGDLSKAVLASMAVPGILAPVKFKDRFLIDGGIKNNIPIDVVRDMGAQVIIVVDVTTPLKKASAIKTFFSTADQMITMQTQGNAKESLKSLKENDIHIKPSLNGLSTYNYSEFGTAISSGKKATLDLSEKLKSLSLSPEKYALYKKSIKHFKKEMPSIDFVKLNNETNLSSKFIRKHIKIKEGKKLKLVKFEKEISGLYHLDAFDSIDYKILKENERSGLLLTTYKKPSGNDFIRFGLNMSTATEGSSRFSFLTNYTMTQLNGLHAEWRTKLKLGQKHELYSEFYQPLALDMSFFILPMASISYRSTQIYSNGTSIDTRRFNNATIGISLGSQLGRWGEIKAGMLRGFGKLETKIGAATQDSQPKGGGAYFANFCVDTLDNFHFPHRGIFSDLSWTHSSKLLGSVFDSDTFELSFLSAKTWGYHTILLSLDGGTTLNANTILSDNFSLGGFLNLSGFSQDGLSGQHKILGQLIYYLKVSGFSKGLITFPVYIGAAAETGNVWMTKEQIDFDSLTWAGSAFIGIETFLGPIYLGIGVREGWNQVLYLTLGRVF